MPFGQHDRWYSQVQPSPADVAWREVVMFLLSQLNPMATRSTNPKKRLANSQNLGKSLGIIALGSMSFDGHSTLSNPELSPAY